MRDEKHCSGEWNEYRKFRCNYKLHYSPNFRQVIIYTPCNNDPAIIERNKLRDKVYNICIHLD